MASNEILYREWQYPRLSSFLPLILLVPAVWIVAAPFNGMIGIYLGAGLAAIATAVKISAAKTISVTQDSLILGEAKIPREFIGEITLIEKDDQFLARGANLDARAFLFLKYGLPEMLRLEMKDPKDPTPYLLVSTRGAKALKQALT